MLCPLYMTLGTHGHVCGFTVRVQVDPELMNVTKNLNKMLTIRSVELSMHYRKFRKICVFILLTSMVHSLFFCNSHMLNALYAETVYMEIIY